jgi:hypothetical protein
MKKAIFWTAAGVMALSTMASGYEITTHALIADYAYRISVLNPATPNSIAVTLGFDRLDADYPFSFNGGPENTPYRDEAPLANPASTLPLITAVYTRFPQPQEGEVLDALVSRGFLPGTSGQAVEQRVRSWLLRGAVREDDNDAIVPVIGWYNPDHRDVDPFGHLLRAVKHFYDPVYDRAFDYPNYCTTYTCVRSILWATGRTNPLTPGSDADDTGRRNHFTWQDARNNYWWSLVLKRDSQGNGYDFGDAVQDGYERMTRSATIVNDLGHVIHLLQDTAQPQHVRNDAHGPPLAAAWPEGEADAAYEAFTDYRVLGNRSGALGIALTGNPLRRMYDDTLPNENNLPAIKLGQSNFYPGGGGHVQFSTPVKFFTTRHIETGTDDGSLRSRRGLADMSNRSFFTAGTLPGFRECQPPGTSGCVPTPGPTYTLPPNDLTASGYTEVAVPTGLRVHGQTVLIGEYAYPVADAVAPNYDQAALAAYGGKAPLVTKGIWHDIIPDDLRPQFLESTGYVITYNDMRYMADVMVPRAVGYSAGMIDFFFRGRMKVEVPQDGLFAVTDQGIPHSVDGEGYPRCTQNVPAPIAGEPPLCTAGSVFGFVKLRVKLRNDTPAIIESGTGTSVPQSMLATSATPTANGPRLVAVARYHRNPCYQPSLAGEKVIDANGSVTVPNCPLGNRSAYQEISVSKPASASAADLNGTTSVPMTFDFGNDPIPVNATDLFVQVVYRGPLGDEPDGIAVGSYDVREPSYLTLWNNSDYAGCNGQWVTHDSPGCAYGSGGTTQRAINTARLCIGTQLLYTRFMTGGNGVISPGGSVRLAALLDDQPHSIRGRLLVGVANTLEIRSRMMTGQSRQALKEQVTPTALYQPDAMFAKRGMVGSFQPLPFYLLIGADPQPSNDMGAQDVGNLTPTFAPAALPDGLGEVSFPNTPPAPNSACTAPPAPFFEDEIEAVLVPQPLV